MFLTLFGGIDLSFSLLIKCATGSKVLYHRTEHSRNFICFMIKNLLITAPFSNQAFFSKGVKGASACICSLIKNYKISQSRSFLDFTHIWQMTTICFPYMTLTIRTEREKVMPQWLQNNKNMHEKISTGTATFSWPLLQLCGLSEQCTLSHCNRSFI